MILDFFGTLFKSGFYTIALILIVSKLFQLMLKSGKLFSSLLSFKTNLTAKYGKNSWAVITGATDGIGKAFVFELANDGFNIVLVGRNREKLEQAETELKSKYQMIQTRIIVEDSKNATDDNFSQRILDQLKGLDVSFLVNNAAMAIDEDYINIPAYTIKDFVMTNALAPALMTRALLPIFAERKRSAIITVSSIAAEVPKKQQHLYGATKAFVDFLHRAIKDESTNIDFLTLKPSYVSTKMMAKDPKGPVVTPNCCARSTLRSLGHTDVTYGDWKHGMQAAISHQMPTFIRKKML